jgi:hypothetical protein
LFVLNLDGSFVYLPAADFYGTDTFTYQVRDGNGGTSTATVSISILPTNDRPVGVGDHYLVTQGQELQILQGTLSNDFDVEGDALIATLVSMPSHGVLLFSSDGSFRYFPSPGFAGMDAFSYIPNDATGGGNVVTVDIEVIQAGDAPITSEEDTRPDPNPEGAEGGDKPLGLEFDLDWDSGKENSSEKPALAIHALNLIDDPRFQMRKSAVASDSELEDQFELLYDQNVAREVLQVIMLNANEEMIEQSEPPSLRVSGTLGAAFDANQLWRQGRSMDGEQTQLLTQLRITLGAVTALGTAGYVVWSLRGGVLFSTFMAQLPSWRLIDPLPILDAYGGRRGSGDDELSDYFE